MTKVVITQSNYIPWKGYFRSLKDITYFIYYDEVQYTKRDWRNRNLLISPNGPKWLSIPVDVKGKYFQKISETKVADKLWSKNHWNFIENNYKKSPFFKEYSKYFKPIYDNIDTPFLSEINLVFLKKIFQLLDLKFNIISSSKFSLNGNKSEKLLNICKELNATEYISAPAAKDYLDIKMFNDQNIKVNWYDYSNFKKYNQQWDNFDHSVSILDMFFNLGPNIKKYIFNEKK